MTNNKKFSDPQLRKCAEQRLAQTSAGLSVAEKDKDKLLHELQVHQIELEMQNDELRRSQLELDASRAEYFDFYNMAPVGYCTLSERGLVLQANLTVANLLSTSRDALVNHHLIPFVLKDDQDSYYLFCKQLLATSEAGTCELRMVKPDGAQIWMHLAATVARNSDNEPVLRMVLSDAERKRAEDALASSEQLFRNYFDHGQMGMAITSTEKGWLKVNDRLCEMLGYTSDELTRTTWTTLTHPDDLEPDLIQFRRLLSGEIDRYEMDKRFIRKDGNAIHTHLTVACQRKPDRSVDYVIASLVDITGRVRREQELRDSRRRLAKAESIAHVGNWSYEVATQAVEWSEEVWHIFGREPGPVELKYDTFVSWLRDDFRAFHDHKMNQMLALSPGETLEDYTFCLVRPNGEERWVEISLEAEFDAGGKPLRFFGIVKDITERRQLEATLWEFNATLEQRVTERTNELIVANAKMEEFAARLQAMSRRYAGAEEAERRRLARELHDRVSSSLTAVGLSLGLITKQLPEDAGANIRDRLSNTAALLKDTMLVAREISHDLHPAVLEHSGVFYALKDYGQQFSSQTCIAVEMIGEDLGIRLPPETEVALYRITQEALTNCAKHAHASVVTIAFSGDVNRVTFMISDNGVGFDLMKLTDSENVPGLGLLSMRERAEAVGGTVTFKSVPGLGTRITIEISNLALDYSGVINAPSE